MSWYVIESAFFIYNLIIDKAFSVKSLGWSIIVISDLLDALNANAAIKGFRLDIENAVGIDFNHFLRLGSIGTKLIISFLMIIGGAPGSTSGGIRITSIAILALTVRATLRNKKNVVVYYKKIDLQTIRQAITNIVICAMLVLISMFIMEKVQIMRLDNNLFMCASAFSATGLSVTNVAKMNFASKVILEALMYIGRVGPISILSILIFKKKENQNIEYVSGNVML